MLYVVLFIDPLSTDFFSFNATSTTETYTYLHTLSLHDALPISPSSIASRISCSSSPVTVASTSTAAVFCIKPQDQRAITTAPTKPMAASIQTHPRSEEHTSELQSLMRISYADICLKKQNRYDVKCYNHNNKPNKTTYTSN